MFYSSTRTWLRMFLMDEYRWIKKKKLIWYFFQICG